MCEESQRQFLRDMRSIGVELKPEVDRGMLRFRAIRSTHQGIDMHLEAIYKLIRQEQKKVTVESEQAFAEPGAGDHFVLRLFLSGMTPRSAEAFSTIKAVCEEDLQGRYELDVIDIYQQPNAADDDQIMAVPALVKKPPAPLRRLIDDLSNQERVLVGLGLQRKPPEQS